MPRTPNDATHGLRRTNADKRRSVETLLRDEEWQKWSDREIARQCNVDHKTVANYRQVYLGNSQDRERYVQRNGTTYTMNTANIGVQPFAPPTVPTYTPSPITYQPPAPVYTPPAIPTKLLKQWFLRRL